VIASVARSYMSETDGADIHRVAVDAEKVGSANLAVPKVPLTS
jgi:hypothetical protein